MNLRGGGAVRFDSQFHCLSKKTFRPITAHQCPNRLFLASWFRGLHFFFPSFPTLPVCAAVGEKKKSQRNGDDRPRLVGPEIYTYMYMYIVLIYLIAIRIQHSSRCGDVFLPRVLSLLPATLYYIGRKRPTNLRQYPVAGLSGPERARACLRSLPTNREESCMYVSEILYFPDWRRRRGTSIN